MRLTATQSFKVVNYLLANPSTSQVEIARKIGASRDLVNHVVQELEAPGIVSQKAREHLELVEQYSNKHSFPVKTVVSYSNFLRSFR